MLDSCPVCGAFAPAVDQFKVTFPGFSLGGRAGFALDEDPGVPFWTIARCPVCTVLYACPRPTPDELADYYRQEHASAWEREHYVEPPERTRRAWAEFAGRLTRLTGGPGSMLEVGCAAGWLLKGARELGWKVGGLEPSAKFYKYAREALGLPVIGRGTPWLSVFPPRTFDCVVSTDVIEHLHDPVADLRQMRRVLKDNGYLVLATCDIESPDAKRYGVHWRQVVVSHTFYWTRKSMAIALERSGFTVQSFSAFRYWSATTLGERARFVKEAGKYWIKRAIKRTGFPRSWADRIDQPVLGDVLLVVARPSKASRGLFPDESWKAGPFSPFSRVAEETGEQTADDAAQAAPQGAASL